MSDEILEGSLVALKSPPSSWLLDRHGVTATSVGRVVARSRLSDDDTGFLVDWGVGGSVRCDEDELRLIDFVDHPTHYTSDPSGVECIQITRHRTFNVGNAIKYLWRAGLKDADATVEDLRKAVWYINDEIERIGGAK